ncbi:MAG TPA: hypothetical protein VGW38_27365, partial [Chloroflexota bacterium]|nr:hypothetical protein [Chloroflexota bacterium]
FRTRVRTYHCLLLVFWVARFARALYEVPRGLDRRLATRPAAWHAETTAKYDYYLQRARAALAQAASVRSEKSFSVPRQQ